MLELALEFIFELFGDFLYEAATDANGSRPLRLTATIIITIFLTAMMIGCLFLLIGSKEPEWLYGADALLFAVLDILLWRKYFKSKR